MDTYLICYLFALNLLSTKMFSFSCVFATFFDFIFCFFLCPGMTRTSALMCTVTETMKRPDVSERNLPSSKSMSPFCPKLCWKDKNQTNFKLLSAELCSASSDQEWAGSVVMKWRMWVWNQINFTESGLSSNMGDWDTFRTACDTLCIISDKRINKKQYNIHYRGEKVIMHLAPRCKSYSVAFFHLPVMSEEATEGRTIRPSQPLKITFLLFLRLWWWIWLTHVH